MTLQENKYKIGVLTYSPNSLNPGGIFVAWSLVHYLNGVTGLDAELIDYECFNRKIFNHGMPSLGAIWFKYSVWRSGNYKSKIKKYPAKESLVKDNIRSINGRYDMVLVGGDQVWNLTLSHNDKNYFLGFVENALKGAYAPSIGFDDWPDEVKPEIKGYLEDFKFIGIREKQSALNVQKLTGKPVHWSLDPVFLLNKSEWSAVARTPKEKPGSYIMNYCLKRDMPLFVKVIERAVRELGVPAIECYGGRKRVPSAIKKHNVGPDRWLGYLLNAKMVIADSFHAVAFCINNNKPFYAFISRNGNRIISILELFGLQDRLITSAEEMDFSKGIDWEPVNKKLEEVRKENQDWLKYSIFKAFEDDR